MSFEDASTLGCAIFTIGLGFYRYLEMPFLSLPLEESNDNQKLLLIYGGSSASGTIAIQFAKLWVPKA